MSNDGPNESPKLWGGRFTESTDTFVEAFTASVTFDKRLLQHDIRGSIAHATMLSSVGVLSEEVHHKLCAYRDNILSTTTHERPSKWPVARKTDGNNIHLLLTFPHWVLDILFPKMDENLPTPNHLKTSQQNLAFDSKQVPPVCPPWSLPFENGKIK